LNGRECGSRARKSGARVIFTQWKEMMCWHHDLLPASGRVARQRSARRSTKTPGKKREIVEHRIEMAIAVA